MDFDYAAARQAGYTDDQILAGLDKQGLIEFDLPAARKAGYSAGDILQSLYGKRQAAPDAAEPESSGLLRRAGDLGISAVKGIIGVPEALVGLADIPTGGAAGRAAESLGVKFKESKDILSDYYSPEQKAANQRVAEAEGFTGTAGAMLANPSTIAQTAVESLPAMGLGGAVGRGVLAVAPKLGALGAAAIGEGAVGAGTAAEQIRQQSGGDLSIGQAGAALASGIGTGAFGLVGGRLAQKFGIADIDTALVQVGAPVASSKGVARRLLEGGISEGVFEELPQSMQEQIWQNAAMDKPLLDGVPEAAAQGLIVGGLFGGVAGGALNGKAPAPAVDPVTGEAAPLQLGYKPDPFISFPDGSVGRQSDVDAFINGLPEGDRLAARSRLYGYAPEDAAPAVTADDVLATVGNPDVGIDDAINLAQQALASDTPDMAAARDAQIDAAWKAYIGERATQRQAELDAAEQQRRDADVPAMESQLADQQVEQAEILTRAQGFDEPAPTAMQVAMQEAQAKRQAAISAAAAPAPAPAPEPQTAPQNIPENIPATAPATAAPGAVGDNLARAKQILTAAGVTGNERMTALRAIRTGENTLDDLIDAHPPKEIANGNDAPAGGTGVRNDGVPRDEVAAPVQQSTEAQAAGAARADNGGAQPAVIDARPADENLVDAVAPAAPAPLSDRAAQRQSTIDDLAGRSTKELRALAKSDKRAYVRNAVAEIIAERDSETRAKRSDVAKRALAKAKQIDPDRDTMAEAIARMGGIQRTSAQGRMRFAPEEVRARAGIRPLFPVNGGMRLEDMAAALAELGYVQRDENGKYDQSDFEEKLAEVAGGSEVRTPQGMMLRAQQEYEAAQQQAFAESPAEYEQIEYYADQADDELQRIVDAAFDAPPTNKEMTDEEIDAAFGIAPAASRAIPEVDTAEPARESGGRDQAPAGDDFGLTSESADEGRARVTADEQRQQQAARDERAAADRERQDRDRRDIAARQDASADNFQLGQSAEDSLSGQDALFSTAPHVDQPQTLADVRAAWDDAGIKNFISERNGIIHLSQIVVPKESRSTGAGTRAMQQLIDYADRTGQRITLTPSADFGGNKSRLVTFYKRFGFIENKGRNKDYEISEAMYRPADGARASTSPAASRGMPAAEVTKAIAPLRAKWAGFTRVNVVQSADGLPADIRERVTVDEGSEGFYDPRTHAVYLIADNIADASRAAWVAAHEVIGHGGLRMLNDKTVTQAVQQAGANRFVRDLAAAIQKDRGGDLAQNIAVEEGIAELSAAIETGDFDGLAERYGVTVPEAARNGIRGVVGRVIAAVRQFLATVAGNPASEFSDADVRELIAQQRAAVEGNQFTDASEMVDDGAVRASIPANQRTIEVDGQRRPINYSDGTPIAADFAGQMEFWQNFDGETDSRGRPIRDEETEADAPRASRAAPPQPSSGQWESPEITKFDDLIHAMQDKQVDLKRVVAAIRESGKTIDDNFDPYLQEELFYGRSAKGVKDFLDTELRPMVEEMRMRGVAMSDFEEYLWNRHAEERNEQIAKINDKMPDGGSGIKTKDARAYLAALPAEKRKAYVSLAKHIDAINAKTREILVSSGLEAKSKVDAWQGAYESYVPLQREDVDTGGNGTGQGFSIRGNSTKRAVGSNKPVADIIANIAMQREKTVVRAEKNRVAQALMGLAKQNPNADFWEVDNAPTERVVQKIGGVDKVVERIVPGFKTQDNVVLARVAGEDHFIIFDERDPRAVRMARSIKNLDADQLGRVLSAVAKGTRYLAAINTQYNPIFGIINLIRDSQGALLNLSTTKIAGDQDKVLKYTVHALRGIYSDLRAKRAGKASTSAWAVIFDEFQNEGGQTGFRDQFANAEARGEAIAKEIAAGDKNIAFKVGGAMFNWLSDYNDVMENAVRLAAYRAAKERGLSKQQAASLAKNLTVNFNRKGQVATQVGALYAFFNAATQGTARLAETLSGPMGKKIIIGGILLGAMQALLLAGSDLDDEEPPEFVRSRSLILPIGDKRYLTLPMPLGFHVLPNLGRIPMEFMMSGFREPTRRVADLVGLFADTFNPIGNAGISLQTIAPSLVDPLAALSENRDWTGKQIARGDLNSLAPTPGYTRANNTATTWSKAIAYGLNILSGGTDYKPGLVSPTPDQLDYLIGQATGGVGRELSKFNQVAVSAVTGEDLPIYKVPLVGRFVGNASGQAAESGKFYSAIKRINQHEAEIKGLREERRTEDVIEYMRNNREAMLVQLANRTESELRKMKKVKREAVDAGQKDRVKAIEQRIEATMANFNQRVALARERSGS